jgi:hypothetical protein
MGPSELILGEIKLLLDVLNDSLSKNIWECQLGLEDQ